MSIYIKGLPSSSSYLTTDTKTPVIVRNHYQKGADPQALMHVALPFERLPNEARRTIAR